MRLELKHLKPWLESWGAWRRLQINIGYPVSAMSCNPDLHIALPIVEPPFKMPAFLYDVKMSLEENALLNLARLRLAERRLREYHNIKRAETKPQRQGIVPNYNPNWRMNLIDKRVQALSSGQKEIIFLRYECELKTKELQTHLARSRDAINSRLRKAHCALMDIPNLMHDRYAPINAKISTEAHYLMQ